MRARSTRNRHAQWQIADRAARLLAEGSEQELAAACRKAALQLGNHDPSSWPDQELLEQALSQYRALFDDEHPQRLQELRQAALAMMGQLQTLSPLLSGDVLSGVAGEHASIELLAEAEDEKRAAILLTNLGLPFEWRQGGRFLSLSFEAYGQQFHLTLLPRGEWLKASQRRNEHGQRVTASSSQLAALLDEATPA